MTKTRHLNANMARMNMNKTLTEKNRPLAQIIAVQLTRACLGSAHADHSQTEIDQHNLEAKEQKRIHITESIISCSKYQRNTI